VACHSAVSGRESNAQDGTFSQYSGMVGRRGRENLPEGKRGCRWQGQQMGKCRQQKGSLGHRELGIRTGAGFVILMPVIGGQVYAMLGELVGLFQLRARLAGELDSRLPIRLQTDDAGRRRSNAKTPMQQKDDYQRQCPAAALFLAQRKQRGKSPWRAGRVY